MQRLDVIAFQKIIKHPLSEKKSSNSVTQSASLLLDKGHSGSCTKVPGA
jgi:hypothetical protein